MHDGDSMVIDGFTHLICFAAGHEIIRQGRKRLTAIRLTPDVVYDQLIEAGCVEKLVFSWAGNPGVGSLHAMRRRSEASSKERLQLEEYSHFGLLARFMAGSAGLPFWPQGKNYSAFFSDAGGITPGSDVRVSGIKVGKVAQLKDDLAYALAATDIRILAPIPGKQAVGVEVPNLSPNLVTLGDIFGGNAFQLCLFLVADLVAGQPVLPAAGSTRFSPEG